MAVTKATEDKAAQAAKEEVSAEDLGMLNVEFKGNTYVIDTKAAFDSIDYWEASQSGKGILTLKYIMGDNWELFKQRHPNVSDLLEFDKALGDAMGGN